MGGLETDFTLPKDSSLVLYITFHANNELRSLNVIQ